MNQFAGKLKDVEATTEWVATHQVIPAPRHIYLMLLTSRGRKRWSVVHLLTEEEFAKRTKAEWEAKGLDWHPSSFQGLWIHVAEVKP